MHLLALPLGSVYAGVSLSLRKLLDLNKADISVRIELFRLSRTNVEQLPCHEATKREECYTRTEFLYLYAFRTMSLPFKSLRTLASDPLNINVGEIHTVAVSISIHVSLRSLYVKRSQATVYSFG